jgi:hypothetical protein
MIAGVTVGEKVYFAGGVNSAQGRSNRIDIYDNATGAWSTSTLKIPGAALSAIAQAGKIYWAAGCDVEIMDVQSSNSAIAHLSSQGEWVIDDGQNAVLKDNKIIFFRYTYPADKFDIYDIATNTWSVGVLPQHNIENASIIAVNNTIYIAGGDARNGTRTNQVFTLEF